MDIGEKIRAARLEKGLTQEELGQMLGVQKSAIAKYENGRVVNIKRSTLKKISDILGINPVALIVGEEEMKKNNTLADIVIRLRSDSLFLSVVETLHKDPQKLKSISVLLNVSEAVEK